MKKKSKSVIRLKYIELIAFVETWLAGLCFVVGIKWLIDSLVCHTAVGANLPSTLVQSSQRTVCQLGVVLHRYRLDCIYIYNACHLFPFLYVKLHRVLRNVTGYGRGVVATQYAPLTTVFNPSVTA